MHTAHSVLPDAQQQAPARLPAASLVSWSLSAAAVPPAALMILFWAKGIHLTWPEATSYSVLFVAGPMLALAGCVLAVAQVRANRTGITSMVISVLVFLASVSGWFYLAQNLHK
jgi:hypothetical protein